MQQSSYAQVLEELKAGTPAIFPTDTVYGIGVAVDFARGPKELCALKGRSENKPVAWLVGDASALDVYGQDVHSYVRNLAQRYWPGALTLIVKANSRVPAAYQSHDGTIGLRMPDSPQTLTLIQMLGCPLATTSANITGEPAPKTFEELNPALVRKVGAVLASGQAATLDGAVLASGQGATLSSAMLAGEQDASLGGVVLSSEQDASPSGAVLAGAQDTALSGVASTVVDCTGPSPQVLRQGAVCI